MKKYVKQVTPEWAIGVSHDQNFEIATVTLEHKGTEFRRAGVHEAMSIVMMPPEEFTTYQAQKAYSYYKHYVNLSYTVLMNPDDLIRLGFDVIEVTPSVPTIIDQYETRYVTSVDELSILVGIDSSMGVRGGDTYLFAVVDEDMDVLYQIHKDPIDNQFEQENITEQEVVERFDVSVYEMLVRRVCFMANHLRSKDSVLAYCNAHMEPCS